MLQWEQIAQPMPREQGRIQTVTYRVQVAGGWLVRVVETVNPQSTQPVISSCMAFVHDEKHIWRP